MKTVHKICLINVAVVLFLAALLTFSFSNFSTRDYIGVLGLTTFLGGILDLLVGLVLLLFRKRAYGQGFLLAAGVLLLLGFAVCSTVL